MKVMTRKEALAAGLKRYFTGKPCPKGHLVQHRIYGGCCECARLGKIVWRKANPERVKELKAAEQKRNRSSANVRNRRYAAVHRDELRVRNAAWQKANPALGAAKTARYLTAKRKQCPKWADHDAIGLIYRAAEVIRVSGFDVHVDHVVPLQGKTVSGLHVHNNLQIIEAKANQSKSNQFQH